MQITGAGWLNKFNNSVDCLSRWFEWIGLASLAIMCLVALLDVAGNKVFGKPLPGSTEIIGVIQITAIAAGLAYSNIDKRHIRVDFLVEVASKKIKVTLELFRSILGFVFFAVASWTAYTHGCSLMDSGTTTFLLGVPLFPFAFWLALGCILMCLSILVELLRSIERMLK